MLAARECRDCRSTWTDCTGTGQKNHDVSMMLPRYATEAALLCNTDVSSNWR